MPVQPGSHTLGPDNATLQVKTYREGLAQKVGHDLVIDVTAWEATVTVGDRWAVSLNADPQSLHVREGLRGLKPLSDGDRADIRKSIEKKVLGRAPIRFRSADLQLADGRLSGPGELEMAGSARPIDVRLTVADDGSVGGSLPVTQSEWGIKPYRGLMGALKVKDEIEVVIEARLPVA